MSQLSKREEISLRIIEAKIKGREKEYSKEALVRDSLDLADLLIKEAHKRDRDEEQEIIDRANATRKKE